MDRRSWPWKKKSSVKTDKAAVATDSGGVGWALASSGSQAENDKCKTANYIQISVESYTHLSGLKDQLKGYEQQILTLEKLVDELNGKLSLSDSEMAAKDNLVKQHAKVAEEAVSGWEKAEAEALALKNHLESVTLSKLAAEDRASHLDGALKECMRQIRNLKEEHELKLQDVVQLKSRQCEKIKLELEAKIYNLDQELLRSEAQNAALSRSLQERSNMIIKISEEKSQAEAEIEILKSNIELCEKEINSLKYELSIFSKELEIRNEEKNMSMRSAEVANKQHMEGVKKIAKLEAECQRLRGLVRKRLPGPAALAQMKLEVESFGREFGDSRLRGSPVKPPSHHPSAVTEFSLDNAHKFHKENDFLTERLLAMEEETKMLKEALAKRNSELQASRNLCAKTASKLQSLEAQVSNEQKSLPTSVVQVPTESYSCNNISTPPSLISMSEDGNDDDRSCADSLATSEFSQFKKEKNGTQNAHRLELMDDFLEMEKLASIKENGTVTISDSPSNRASEIVSVDTSRDVSLSKDSPSEKQQILVSSANHVSSNTDSSAEDSGSGTDQSPLTKLQSRISMMLESTSRDTDMGQIIEDVKRMVQDAHDAVGSVSEEVRTSDASFAEDASIAGNKEIISSQDIKSVTEPVSSVNQELATSISCIHDFVSFLGKEEIALHDKTSDGSDLSRKIDEFSITFNQVIKGNANLVGFVHDLSNVLATATELRFNVLGYKGSETEISSNDCVDKVALPENKALQRASSGESYQNGFARISSPVSNLEVPDCGNLVSGYGSNATSCKVSVEEFEELKSEKNHIALDLARCTDNLEISKSQLQESEQLLAEAKLQLASAQKSNSLAETQLKCMTESYRSLEARAVELEAEVNLLQTKAETLEDELRDEKQCHLDALARCKELEEQLQTKESCSVCSSTADAEFKTNQDKELAAAAEKLAECQETIFVLGKQLNALRPQTELMGSPNRERIRRRDGISEDVPGMMNLQDFCQAQMDNNTISTNLNNAGSESPRDFHSQPCSPSHSETSLQTSPIRSINGPVKSISPSEKHPRGFSRFFSTKGN